MNDCLVTKLKGSVQNDNLPKLGVLKFWVPATTGQYIALKAAAGDPCKISAVDRSIAEYTIPVDPESGGIVPPTNAGYLEISNKYALKAINLSFTISANTPDDKTLDITELNYLTSLVSFSFKLKGNLEDYNPVDPSIITEINVVAAQTILGGNISTLTRFVNLVSISFNTCNAITGTLQSLAPLANITKISFPGCRNITGSIEAYVAACVALGRTNGEVFITVQESGITWKGNTIAANQSGTMTWSTSGGTTTITYLDETVTI